MSAIEKLAGTIGSVAGYLGFAKDRPSDALNIGAREVVKRAFEVLPVTGCIWYLKRTDGIFFKPYDELVKVPNDTLIPEGAMKVLELQDGDQVGTPYRSSNSKFPGMYRSVHTCDPKKSVGGDGLTLSGGLIITVDIRQEEVG